MKEYSNSRILLERQVNEYNKASSNLNTAALNTLKKVNEFRASSSFRCSVYDRQGA